MVDDESAIIQECQKGAMEPFRILVDRYKEKAYFFALSYVGNQEDALDLSQDAFIKAYRSLKYFKLDLKFSCWFFRILRNICIDFLREKKRKRQSSMDGGNGRDGFMIPDSSLSPDILLERDTLRKKIWEEVKKLKDVEKEVFVYKDIHGLSYEEIADIMEIPKGTVASTLHKARKKLKEKLKKYL